MAAAGPAQKAEVPINIDLLASLLENKVININPLICAKFQISFGKLGSIAKQAQQIKNFNQENEAPVKLYQGRRTLKRLIGTLDITTLQSKLQDMKVVKELSDRIAVIEMALEHLKDVK